MLRRHGANWGRARLAARYGLGLVAALLGIGVATAQELVTTPPAGSDRFWVQDRPLSGLVSTDLLTQDRRFAGGLGYGLNLLPPDGSNGLALGGRSGGLSLDNLHLGLDVQHPYGTNPGESVAQFAMGFGGQVSDSWALSVGPTLSLGNDSAGSLLSSTIGSSGGFMRHLQGDTGLRDYGLRGSATYSLSDSWALTGVLGYRRSLGELGITTSDDQFFSVLGLGYRF
jgi:hypothetical protein